MAKLLLLFILVPALELAVLLEIGRRIGVLATMALIFATGAVGALLARSQGWGVWRKIQLDLNSGRIPAGSLLDGLLILIAAAFLVTPGIITDALGFALLIPFTRGLVKKELGRRFARASREGRVEFSVRMDSAEWQRSEPIDVTPQEPEHKPSETISLPADRES